MSNRTEEIIIVSSTTVIIGVLLSFYYYVLKMFKQKQQYYFRELEIIKVENEKSILKAQVEVQESVFRKISQDIHDNISLTLALAKLNVNTFLMSQTHLKFDQLQSATDLIGRSLLDLNNISRSLNSDIVAHYGLTRATEMEFDKLNQFGKCEFRFDVQMNYEINDPRVDLELFRIIQEASNNILKHAEACHATVSLTNKDSMLILEIQDDGKGFDDNTLVERRALAPRSGLKNIQNRAYVLNGEASINSFPGKGTKITVTIPLSNDKTTN